jgi:hypothetical protein
LYGANTWILRREGENRVLAFEMWVWRRMGKVKWTEIKTNEEVLGIVGKERRLLKEMRKRQNW